MIRDILCGVGTVLVLGLLPAVPAGGGSPIPYGGEFREAIEEALFERDGASSALGTRVSKAKLRAYREFIRKKLRFLSSHVYNYETVEEGRSDRKAKATVADQDVIIALEHVLDLLDRLEGAEDLPQAYRLAAEILMIEYATRSFTVALASIHIPVHLKNTLLDWSVANRTRPRGARKEASNLVDPATGEFYTPEELEALIRAGRDISRLNPPLESPFWRAKEDISKVDVISNYLEGGDPVNEGMVAEFPPFEGAEVDYRKAHKTQSKPKLDVTYMNERCREKSKQKRKKCRQRIKLKFGMETHADPVANALIAALGYNVDVAMHLRRIRINLGDHTFEELQADWAGYFDRQRLHLYFPLETVLLEGEQGHGRDAKGEYVVFREAVAEVKPEELHRIGFFSFSSGMAAVMREARGLFLFNVWIANADMKDEENNKLILRRDAEGDLKMYLVQQDLGHAMGLVLAEKPNAFPWDAVEVSAFSRFFGWIRGRMELNYLNLQDNGLEETATYADAKWMARLIAQLTRKQIADAVGLGRWPGGIADLYVEKLIHRRNQFVEAFGLEHEFALLPVDHHISTPDGSVVDGRLVRNRWEHSSMRYREHWRDMFGPVGGYLADMAKSGFQRLVASFDRIDPGEIEITSRFVIDPDLLLDLSREVRSNPHPQASFDQYIVRDSVGLGIRVGAGYIGSAEGAWFRRISLAYPAATRRLAINAGNRVINLLLPYDVRKGRLPERYVLLREEMFRAGVRVRPDDAALLSPVGAGLDASQDWVLAHRSAIDHRDGNPVVWLDESRFLDREIRAFLELAVLHIPFFAAGQSGGSLAGEAWTLDASRLAPEGGDGSAVFDALVRKGDFGEVDRIRLGDPRRVALDFDTRQSRWSLFFAGARFRAGEDGITLMDGSGAPLREEYRAEMRNESYWSFLDNGETQSVIVKGYLGALDGEDRVAEEPIVAVRYSVDDLNTHSDEFNSYYGLLEGLGAGRRYMAEGFAAEDWEVSGREKGGWTRLLTSGRVRLYGEALQRLTELEEAGYWTLLARNLGLDPSRLARYRARLDVSDPKQRMMARRSSFGREYGRAIRRSSRILRSLRAARDAPSDRDRLKLLVKALYLANFRSGDTFDPILMATLLEWAGIDELVDRGQLLVAARITRAFDDENNLPERRDVVGRLGKERDFRPVDYTFFPFDAVELYNMLNWVREIE
jgi:hypothetical protein